MESESVLKQKRIKMKMNLLKKTAVCLLAGTFLAGSAYAGTTGSKTSTNKGTSKKNDPFAADNSKKDKTTAIGPSGWSGTITITPSSDASGKLTASFTNGQDSKQYNIQIDDATNKILANIKTGSKVQIKGSVVSKTDGTSFVKLTDCTLLPDNSPQPAS